MGSVGVRRTGGLLSGASAVGGGVVLVGERGWMRFLMMLEAIAFDMEGRGSPGLTMNGRWLKVQVLYPRRAVTREWIRSETLVALAREAAGGHEVQNRGSLGRSKSTESFMVNAVTQPSSRSTVAHSETAASSRFCIAVETSC